MIQFNLSFCVILITTSILFFPGATAERSLTGSSDGDVSAIPISEWNTLGNSLSSNASLYGPLPTSSFERNCMLDGTNSDAYAISRAGQGLCMHLFDCAYQFCIKDSATSGGGVYDLPSYTVEAKTEDDVSNLINFATKHSIEVSIKTTGHSYQGSSSKKNTLLIWLQLFEKDGTIEPSYVDSCGTVHGPVVNIGGGETWNDVIEAVGEDYHIVTGGARTVSAVGGWLQGGGLSFSSRQYGIGVDQVVHFRLVLANGTAVDVNACTNEDLFWALRGGGGGTFGVVTKAKYKLHRPTPITTIDFAVGISANTDREKAQKAIEPWLDFWLEKSPTLPTGWSGFFNIAGCHLVYSGPKDEATPFFGEFMTWYGDLDKSDWISSQIGANPPQMTEYTSWYEYKGGPEAYFRAEATDATGAAYDGIHNMASRLMPESVVMNDPQGVKALLLDVGESLGTVNYFLGGNINNVATDATSVHPALRKSIYSIFTNDPVHNQKVRDFVNNDVTGVCYNHHNGIEPDWRNACWGENYDELESIQQKYDPNHKFNCWHCVGYVGEEKEYDNPKDDDNDNENGGNVMIWNMLLVWMVPVTMVTFL